VSNHLAVATVSAALRSLVDDAAGSVLAGVATNVDTGRPDRLVPPDNEAAISIFLYQVSPNPHWRNDDLQTRSGNGTLRQKPQVALDLYYLMTFFGVDNRQHSEVLLGSVASALHTEPIITRDRIENTLIAQPHLAESDLAAQPELVRFVPVELTLEELSKLWSVFFQTPYRLSVAYKGSVVLISPDEPEPQPTLPVARRNLYVETLEPPRIESLRADAGSTAPVVIGGPLVILGRKLRGDDTRVTIGEAEALPAFVSDRELRVDLTEGPFPAGSLRAGAVGVRVVHYRLMGTPEVPHVGPTSNLCAVVVHPRIPGVPLAATAAIPNYALTVEPVVGTRQAAALLLTSPAASHVIEAAPRATETASLEFDLSGVAPGTYLVRVRIDGAESLLEFTDTDADAVPDSYTGPTLEVTP
jgi:hypothetical protein